MSKYFHLIPAVLLAVFISAAELHSLPIYAFRSARVCDSCHTSPYSSVPGKEWKNPPLSMRKCNMSCLNCHVNPSGGGMRRVAGRYYAQNTLVVFGAQNRPARDQNRSLFNILRYFTGTSSSELGLNNKSVTYREGVKETISKEAQEKLVTSREGKASWFYREDPFNLGAPIGVWANKDQSIYAPDRSRYGSLNADPLITVGLDTRLAYYTPPTSYFPMQFDTGMTLHPMEHISFSATAGLQARKDGFKESLDETDHQLVVAKSAFLLIHELPMNAYLQAGQFLPEFGIRDEDHTAFGRVYFEMNPALQNNLVYGLQFGLAPNYPYFSISYFFNKVDETDKTSGYGYAANLSFRHTSVGGGVSYLRKVRDFTDGGNLQAIGINGYLNLWGLYLPMRYTAPLTLMVEYNIGEKPLSNTEDKKFSALTFRLYYLVANGINLYYAAMRYDDNWRESNDRVWRIGPGLDINLFRGLRMTLNMRQTLPESGEPKNLDYIFFVHGYF